LEAALGAYVGCKHAITVASGTDSLEIALRALEIGPGDEVITVPFTWISTAEAIALVGAKPVFVDIDPLDFNIAVDQIEAAITPSTKALMPVSLFGQMPDYDAINAIAEKYNLPVIEDAAQSIGSSWKGRLIGSFGDLVSFSFHPNKNLTTIEGGCLVMNTPEEASLAEQYRLQGVIRSGMDGMDVEVCGGKFNLTDVAARVGLGQLPHLEAFTEKRRELVRRYFAGLGAAKIESLGVQLPPRDFDQSNWHMFQVVLPEGEGLPKRSEIMERLKDLGVGTGVHYPAIHLFTLYRGLGWKAGDFPIAESVCRTILTLPLFPTMELSDVDRVVSALVSVVSDFQKK